MEMDASYSINQFQSPNQQATEYLRLDEFKVTINFFVMSTDSTNALRGILDVGGMRSWPLSLAHLPYNRDTHTSK